MERIYLSFYKTDSYSSWEEANKSGANYDHEFKSKSFTIEELAFEIHDAIQLATTAIEMMDGSKPFDVAYRTSDSEIDHLKNKSIDEIHELLLTIL